MQVIRMRWEYAIKRRAYLQRPKNMTRTFNTSFKQKFLWIKFELFLITYHISIDNFISIIIINKETYKGKLTNNKNN